jgi:hypothetical protein
MQIFETQAQIEVQSEFNQTNNSYYTTVREPSPDGFNGGSSYRVASQGPLGQAGQTVGLRIRMRNFAKTENWKDKQTGQPRSSVKNFSSFDVLEIIQPKVQKSA